MLAALSRLLKDGLCLMSLRSLGLIAAMQRYSGAQIRAAQYTALAALSGVLALLIGVGAIVLSVSPDLRPLLLGGLAGLLGLGAVVLRHRARSLRRNPAPPLIASLQSIRNDLAIIRTMFDRDNDHCSRCKDRAQTASSPKNADSDPTRGRERATERSDPTQGRERAS